ncbi:hypothetical protein ACWDUN_26775 [Mycobacterium sp. NPDC003323]
MAIAIADGRLIGTDPVLDAHTDGGFHFQYPHPRRGVSMFISDP